MTAFKPMLAKAAPADLSVLTYPQMIQPKLDGIRASVVAGRLVSRSLKPIPNAEIRAALERPEFEGLDGEILVGDPTDEHAMQATSSFVMSSSKTGADWVFYVFDKWDESGPFHLRLNSAKHTLFWSDHPRVGIVPTEVCHSVADVEKWEAVYIEKGYEGAIIRNPNGFYKFGRSGSKGPLLKVKRFQDSEARVVGTYERMHNGNEATTNELGRTQRSSAKAGKTGRGDLGGLECVTPEGVAFRIGTGFNDAQRAALWAERDSLIGKIAKYKWFEVGVVTAPRFPVFIGFRDPLDMDAPSA